MSQPSSDLPRSGSFSHICFPSDLLILVPFWVRSHWQCRHRRLTTDLRQLTWRPIRPVRSGDDQDDGSLWSMTKVITTVVFLKKQQRRETMIQDVSFNDHPCRDPFVSDGRPVHLFVDVKVKIITFYPRQNVVLNTSILKKFVFVPELYEPRLFYCLQMTCTI